jgi:hypothetical protein
LSSDETQIEMANQVENPIMIAPTASWTGRLRAMADWFSA